MKIHFFASSYPVPYKPYYDTQFADLLDQGHEVTIYAGFGSEHPRNERVIQYKLDARTKYFPSSLRTLPKSAAAILHSLAKRPSKITRDIKVASACGSTANQRLGDVARMLAVRGDVPDMQFIHGLGTAIMLRWLRQLHPHIPTVMYYHGGEVPTVHRWQETDVREAFQATDLVFTNTQFSARGAVERGCPEDKLVILPVGFSLQDFQPPEIRPYRRDGKLRLLSAGRMSEEKGFLFALQALKQLVDDGIHDISYSLTGTGYLRSSLEQYVRENELDVYVNFLGTLTTDQVIQAMGEADALVLPSIRVGDWVENQACAVQEAMLMKTLVVTTRTGGVPESIPPEMVRFSAAEGDAAGLAEVIRHLHSLSSGDLELLGAAARAFVTSRYEIGDLNRRMLEYVSPLAGPTIS